MNHTPLPPHRTATPVPAIARHLRAGLLVALGAAALLPQVAAHEHFGAGIVDSNGAAPPAGDEPLRIIPPPDKEFRNASGQTEPTGAGPLRLYHLDGPFAGQEKVFDLLPRPFGFRPTQLCGGYYVLDEVPRTLDEEATGRYLDAFSFAALANGGAEEADPNHAHAGAYLWVKIVSIFGPPGAHFGYWRPGWSFGHDSPSTSFAANQPIPADPLILEGSPALVTAAEASGLFKLSQGFNAAGQDPAGHIHNRSWTADQPGDYFVTYRLVDKSTNRAGGGPWHPPSKDYIFHFRAGPFFQPTPQRIPGTGVVLTWPSLMGILDDEDPPQTGVEFTIQRSTTLQANDWQPIGTVTGTTAATATFTDPTPPLGKAFYRLIYSWSPP